MNDLLHLARAEMPFGYVSNVKMNRDADGRATVEWPDEARGCLISRELLDQMIEEANERTWVRVDDWVE